MFSTIPFIELGKNQFFVHSLNLHCELEGILINLIVSFGHKKNVYVSLAICICAHARACVCYCRYVNNHFYFLLKNQITISWMHGSMRYDLSESIELIKIINEHASAYGSNLMCIVHCSLFVRSFCKHAYQRIWAIETSIELHSRCTNWLNDVRALEIEGKKDLFIFVANTMSRKMCNASTHLSAAKRIKWVWKINML